MPNPASSALAFFLLLAGCSAGQTPQDSSRKTAAQAAFAPQRAAGSSRAVQAESPFLGRWQGPGGLHLDIARGGSANTVTIRFTDTRDGAAAYEGMLVAGGILFKRAGRTDIIRRGTGADSGIPALRDRTDCLVIRPGEEVYCLAGRGDGAMDIPLTPGVFVPVADRCAAPVLQRVRTYNGQGFGRVDTGRCRAAVITRSGARLTIDNACAGGPGQRPGRTTERLLLTIADPEHFSLTSGTRRSRYKRCPTGEILAFAE